MKLIDERIAKLHAEGRLIRGEWSRLADDGRQLLCLYTALAGDADARPETCPASLAPRWVAHLLPWISDAGSEAEWPRVVERMAALAPHLHRLDSRADYRAREIAVREAIQHTDDELSLQACKDVADLYKRAQTETVTDDEWAEVASEAKKAVRAAQAAQAAQLAGASGVVWAARSASAAAEAWPAPARAASAAAKVVWAARSARSVWAARSASAAAGAAREVADRIIDAILSDWERRLLTDKQFEQEEHA